MTVTTMTSNINFATVSPKEDSRWDEFVQAHPDGTIYHHSSWVHAIADTYKYQPIFAACVDPVTDRISEGMPLLFIESKLTGNRLASLPLTAYCPQLLQEDSLKQMISFLQNLLASENKQAQYIELKFSEKTAESQIGLKRQELFATHILDLRPGIDAVYRNFNESNIRRRIKKAEKSNLTFRLGRRESDLQTFYQLESGIRKQHGLPPQPYSFFKNIWEALKPAGHIMLPLVECRGEIVSAAILLKFKDTYYYEYAASSPKFRHVCPNHKLIWEIIQMACSEGISQLDFGRTALNHTSLIRFKERWGATQKLLQYYYYPNFKKVNPAGDASSLYKLMRFLNRRMPSKLLQWEGKLLYPHLG